MGRWQVRQDQVENLLICVLHAVPTIPNYIIQDNAVITTQSNQTVLRVAEAYIYFTGVAEQCSWTGCRNIQLMYLQVTYQWIHPTMVTQGCRYLITLYYNLQTVAFDRRCKVSMQNKGESEFGAVLQFCRIQGIQGIASCRPGYSQL